MLASARQSLIESKVSSINRFGLFNPILFEKERPQGVTRRLHPAPGLVIREVIVKFDRAPQMHKGAINLSLSVGNLTFHHLVRNCQNVLASIDEQVSSGWHCLAGFGKRLG